jgi:hypothetical protein
MATKITYYAIVDDYSSREEPRTALRRIVHDNGQHDEQFSYRLEWVRSPLLYSYERGNGDNDIYEISEEEADRIVERIRRKVTGEARA